MGARLGCRRRSGDRGAGPSEQRQALYRARPDRFRRARGGRRRSEHGARGPRPARAAGGERRSRSPNLSGLGRSAVSSPTGCCAPPTSSASLRRTTASSCCPGAWSRGWTSPKRSDLTGRRPRHGGDAEPPRLPLGARDRARGGGRDRDAARRSPTPASTRTRRRLRASPRSRSWTSSGARGTSRGSSATLSMSPSPIAIQARLFAAGHATDLGRRRRDELRDARDRAAAASVRPRAAERTRHRRPPRRAGGEAGDPRRRGADVHRRRPPDLRRGATGRRRGRDGRRARRGVRADERRPARGGVVRTRRRPTDPAADRPLHRGVDALRARRRSRSGADRRGPGEPVDGRVVRGARAPGHHPGRRPAATASHRTAGDARVGTDRLPGVYPRRGRRVRSTGDRERDRRRRHHPGGGARATGWTSSARWT